MALSIKNKRKYKAFFYKSRLDKFIPSSLFRILTNMSDAAQWIAKYGNKEDHDFCTKDVRYEKREELYSKIIEKEHLNSGIDYLEFGVATGRSFRWWTDKVTHPDAKFYGFDTFTGLPEAYGEFKVGDFSNGNTPPEIDGDRHAFFQGLFQQTLLPFLANYDATRRKVIHLDADIYTATLYVLTLMTPYLKTGDILLFDEFNVPNHEFLAFKNWTESFYINYEVLGSVNNYLQVAIKVK